MGASEHRGAGRRSGERDRLRRIGGGLFGEFSDGVAAGARAVPRARTLAYLERVGALKARKWGAADLKALRAMPAEDIIKNLGLLTLAEYGPVVDGKYVLEAPGQAFANGD